ncbi:hypothetical protein COW36_18910 [bacterium (Candidatus Blackallbacteria) CG17_big_fil_post_rev_8_21_14_2_50_48_46]|uniref:DUF2071 domain-containing protein n=1 Tax=bacterium (Candidatus Blackallbacteria) CG17_big_fil_post_rev_8_21_14_2_50_48_46 TaxID=2014261 RepID=A0A2M7G150_9BACT|nr:MAG: hypothetical protein COW64_25560 [bacterium (Candidatus Blackallbacteria) CG18_big_fil_WC_8_21_14_2_50_49_26]PIW14998.1 MAG: hypothetical protein COW36_18910 [bacterium (Candidatus Blackallbacteria) CG17_big_fil_post_rev_8_21_14_2_50_48_46]PIW50079.1 MAG: hypothetical protein COW20_03845 [bacterium (Candidatus Blackallbacteria) CG13_big_fil_rev_8_21_14_2_50_49_14]
MPETLPGKKFEMPKDPAQELFERATKRPPAGWLSVESLLKDFVMVTYALEYERLAALIHPSLELERFEIQGQDKGLLSIVNFWDSGFHFMRLLPKLRFEFGQTNYRIYVRHRQSGERGVWFWGTCLGSEVYRIPKVLWQLPWHKARYHIDLEGNENAPHYQIRILSDWGAAKLKFLGTAKKMPLLPGFENLATQKLLLTHPITGYFTRPNGSLGSYTIWHPEADLKLGEAKSLSFQALEQAQLLSTEEQQNPHSILFQNQILYQIQLPPHSI